MSAAPYPAGLLNTILWRAANPNHREQPMSNYVYLSPDGITFRSSSPRDLAVRAVEEALRTRRAAHAAYGRTLSRPDYTTPQAERDAQLAERRETIRAAEEGLAAALDALEELL